MEAGDSVAVMGPSGSGKSSFLHIVGVLDTPTSGSVQFDGVDPFSLNEQGRALFRNQNIGFVFQDHHLLPQFTVLENTLLPTLAQKSNRATPDDARKLLERVGLGDRLGHFPTQLSGGERQRTAIARALINRPSVLLCDEPTGNLDQETATLVADLLLEVQGEAVMIMVTHSPEMAQRCQRQVRLSGGSFVPM